ncbi:MAG: hypothetical protein IPG64_17010 [Haliea sp.]|nr:hypothetical protein [Haliea sp.]
MGMRCAAVNAHGDHVTATAPAGSVTSTGTPSAASVALMPPCRFGHAHLSVLPGGYRVDVDGGRHRRRGVASGISEVVVMVARP